MYFLILAFAGAVLLYLSISSFRLGIQSKKWIKTSGQILDTIEVEAQGDASRRNHLMVRYSYEFNGSNYISDKVRFKWGHQQMGSEKMKYRTGSTVNVFVNPDNAGQAVIEPGVDISNYFAIVAGVLAIVFGIGLAIFI